MVALAALGTSALGTSALAADEPCPSPAAAEKAGQPPVDLDAEGSDDIKIRADEGTLAVGGDTVLKGNVSVRQGSREIRANEVEYDASKTALKADGEVEYVDPLVRVRGNGARYSAAEGADFDAAEFELREGSAHGAADQMQISPDGVIRLDGVRFTTCPVTDEAWQLRAQSITLDTRERLGTGRGTRVDFKGVPLIYLPLLSFPLGNERKSGFLFPSAGHSSRGGAQVAVPYYWNIAPQADFTFEPVYYSRRGIDAAGELRYLSASQAGTLALNYLPNDSVADDTRYRFKLDHVAELPREFRFDIDAETVSDTEYFEDFAQGPEGTSTAFVERYASLRYRDENWLLAGEFQHFQTIDRELAEIDQPYARLPRFIVNGDFGWGPAERIRYGLNSELVNFERSTGATGWRLDAFPAASLDLGNAGYFVRPGIAWRYTQYELSDEAPGTRASLSRSLPVASFDAGMLFEKPSGSQGQRRLTLEPRLLYLNIPYRNQDEIPLFDTALPDLNLVQLFRTNRYVGADRVSDANQLSFGVTSRLYSAASGTQYLAATLGQIHYFDSPRVVLPGETPRRRDTSDLVAQLSLMAYKSWNADLGLQWNPDDSQTERSQVRVQYRPGPEQVLNMGYRFQRDRLDQAEVSSAWPLSPRWNLFTRYVHSFRDDTALERFAGFEYRSCCWRVRMLGRRFVSSRTGEQDTGVYLQLELTGLASVGSAADAFLSTAIRGYTRPGTRP